MALSRLNIEQVDAPEDIVRKRLDEWLNNPPDYYDVTNIYTKHAQVKSDIIKVKRQISRAEDEVSAEEDKPRSNDAKKRKIAATTALLDKLAELEAELAYAEKDVKLVEYRKTMFNAASYALKVRMDM